MVVKLNGRAAQLEAAAAAARMERRALPQGRVDDTGSTGAFPNNR